MFQPKQHFFYYPFLLVHQMSFRPPISGFVERPDPMDGMRALAISLEEEDREELGGYVALVLQKLANMNGLFLGEKVPRRAVDFPTYLTLLLRGTVLNRTYG